MQCNVKVMHHANDHKLDINSIIIIINITIIDINKLIGIMVIMIDTYLTYCY